MLMPYKFHSLSLLLWIGNPPKPKTRHPLHPVLTYKEFYGLSSTAADTLSEIARYDFEDILLTLILVNNACENRLDQTIDVYETLANRLPSFKAQRLRYYMNQKDAGKFQLTNGTVIARIVSDLFGLLPQMAELQIFV